MTAAGAHAESSNPGCSNPVGNAAAWMFSFGATKYDVPMLPTAGYTLAPLYAVHSGPVPNVCFDPSAYSTTRYDWNRLSDVV